MDRRTVAQPANGSHHQAIVIGLMSVMIVALPVASVLLLMAFPYEVPYVPGPGCHPSKGCAVDRQPWAYIGVGMSALTSLGIAIGAWTHTRRAMLWLLPGCLAIQLVTLWVVLRFTELL